MSNQELQKHIDFIRFSQACEGFYLTQEDEESIKKILTGESTADVEVQRILKANGLS